MRQLLGIALFLLAAYPCVQAQYEDARCKCICPNPSVVNASTDSNRKYYIGNVPPNKCNCDSVVLAKVGDLIKGKEQEFCPRCECKYESRNTTTIKVVVIIVVWAVSLLVVYMLFLVCLEPLISGRTGKSYQEHVDEDESHQMTPTQHPAGVLDRVGHQQDKWKRQVREQRRNIYDRHTMLN